MRTGEAPRVSESGKLNGKWRLTLTRPLAAGLAPFTQPVLQIVVVPTAAVSVDDRQVGDVSATQLPLEPGAHVVERDESLLSWLESL